MPEFFPFIPGTETSRAARQHASDASPLLGRFRAVPRPRRSSNPFSFFLGGGGQVGDDVRAPLSSYDYDILVGGAGRGGGGVGGNNNGGPSSASLRAVLAAGNRGSVHVGYGALVAASAGLDDLRGGIGGAAGRAGSDDDSEYYDSSDDEGCVRACVRGSSRALRRNVHDLWVAPRQGAVRRVVESWWRRWGLLVFLPAGLVRDISLPPSQGDKTSPPCRSSYSAYLYHTHSCACTRTHTHAHLPAVMCAAGDSVCVGGVWT